MNWMCAAALWLVALGVPVSAGTLAQFRTVFGDIEVELFDQDKPITVGNFIRYVESGRYQDGFIHRCNPDFVIQGGGYYLGDRGTTNAAIFSVPVFGTIPSEFSSGRVFSNTYGTIAMAMLAGDTNSASSQWFFNLTNNSFLDAPDTNHMFTVFGHVVRGTNVLEMFKTFKPYTGVFRTNVIRDLSGFNIPPFNEFPLLAPDAYETNLVFVDVSLLKVHVQTAGDTARTISWNSVTNKFNLLEFTTNFPPVWQTLFTTNGNGAALSVTDTAPGAATRFYRVRVDY